MRNPMNRAFWTDEDDEKLRNGFHDMSFSELCRYLKRTPNAIGIRCRVLGLDTSTSPSFTELQRAWDVS